MNVLGRLLLAPLLLLLSAHVVAEDYQFDFNWVDDQGQQAEITFAIDKERARKAYLEGKDQTNMKTLYARMIGPAQAYARSISGPDAGITVIPDYDRQSYRINLSYRGGGRQTAERLADLFHDYLVEQFKALEPITYYRFNKTYNSPVMNYQSVIKDYQDVIQALNTAFQSRDAQRGLVERIDDRLLFLQTIKYDALDNDDFEFLNPIRLLLEQRGDCESKQIVFAGMLKDLMPGRLVYLVSLRNKEHIVTAFQADEAPEKYTIWHEGHRFLILDATGPSHSSLSRSSARLAARLGFTADEKVWDEVGTPPGD